MTDKRYMGKEINPNWTFFAACNPYKKKKIVKKVTSGLKINKLSSNNNLLYNVFPP